MNLILDIEEGFGCNELAERLYAELLVRDLRRINRGPELNTDELAMQALDEVE